MAVGRLLPDVPIAHMNGDHPVFGVRSAEPILSLFSRQPVLEGEGAQRETTPLPTPRFQSTRMVNHSPAFKRSGDRRVADHDLQ